MRKTRKLLKFSLIKYIILTLLLVGILSLKYVSPEMLHIESAYNNMYEHVLQLGNESDYVTTFIETYYPYIEKYGLLYSLGLVIYNMFLLMVFKHTNSRFLAFVFGTVKIACCSFISGLALLFSIFCKRENINTESDLLVNNKNDNINKEDTPKMTIRNGLYNPPLIAFSSIVFFMFILFIGIFLISITLQFHIIFTIFVSIIIVCLSYVTLIGYGNKARIFSKCCKHVKKGYNVEEVKKVMRKFDIIEEGVTTSGDYIIKYKVKQAFGDDHEGMVFIFRNGELYKKSDFYHRTYYYQY